MTVDRDACHQEKEDEGQKVLLRGRRRAQGPRAGGGVDRVDQGGGSGGRHARVDQRYGGVGAARGMRGARATGSIR